MPKAPRQPVFSPSRLHVLVIDGNNFERRLTGDLLYAQKFRAVQAVNTVELAWSSLDSQRVDIIIIGARLEGKKMPSPALARAIRRRHDGTRRLPIISVLGSGTVSEIKACTDAGINDVLVRPLSSNQLMERLRQVIKVPHPFIETGGYVGPCRRREPLSVYYGKMRRADDVREAGTELANDELGAAFSHLSEVSALLDPWSVGLLPDFHVALTNVLRIVERSGEDTNLLDALDSYGHYICSAIGAARLDKTMIEMSLAAIVKLMQMPRSQDSVRAVVSKGLVRAVRKKMAA